MTTAPASTIWQSTNAPTLVSVTQIRHVAAAVVSAILMPLAKVTVLDLAHVLVPMAAARIRIVQAQFAWTPAAGKYAMKPQTISARLHLQRCCSTSCSRSKLGARTISAKALGLRY